MTELPPSRAPLIQTTRLWLTSFTMDDAADVYAYASIPEVSRYTMWTPHTSLRHAEDFLQYALGEQYCWAIRLYADGSVIGAIECTEEGSGEASIHYVLSPKFWGQGIMTEAARAVIDWAFATYAELQQIRTTVVREHGASRRVLEKCGMGHLDDVTEPWEKLADPVELAVYGLTRDTWQRHHR